MQIYRQVRLQVGSAAICVTLASELEGANITVRQSCGSISSTARMSGFHNLGLAALFALAFLAWGISSLRPLFRSISGQLDCF